MQAGARLQRSGRFGCQCMAAAEPPHLAQHAQHGNVGLASACGSGGGEAYAAHNSLESLAPTACTDGHAWRVAVLCKR